MLNRYLKDLSNLNGVSGCEDEVREYILKEISPYCDDIKTDNLGSIIAFKKGKNRAKNKIMLSAHMDEVGLIVTGITKKGGYLDFSCVGGIDPRVLFGKRFTVGKNKIKGVIGGAPIHMLSSEQRDKAPDSEDLFIYIGAKNKADAEKYVSLGDRCAFDTEFSDFGENFVKGKALDDRAGCAVLIDIIKSDIECDMYFVFAVQEEVGLRGARCAAYDIAPDFAIVVEATTAADIAGVPENKQVCRIDGGGVISFMDRSTIYDKGMYNLAFKIAEEKDIKVQPKTLIAGGNDSGAIHVTGKGIRTLAVSLPCRYLHSPVGIISKDDLKSVRDIVFELSREIAKGDTEI